MSLDRYTLGHVPEPMRLATSGFEERLEVRDAPSAAGNGPHAAQEIGPDPQLRAVASPDREQADTIDGRPRRAAKPGFPAPPPMTRDHVTPILEP